MFFTQFTVWLTNVCGLLELILSEGKLGGRQIESDSTGMGIHRADFA